MAVIKSTGDSDDPDIKEALENEAMQENLLRVAHMFSEFREDPYMRELCRLAIKITQERLIRA